MSDLRNGDWWNWCDTNMQEHNKQIWLTIGSLGYSGATKHQRATQLNDLFGEDGWKISYIVRGRIATFHEAIWEYEQSYRVYLHNHPQIVDFLVTYCGNVYDYAPENVYDSDYHQPNGIRNHYQDISIRRVIAELAGDNQWSQVKITNTEDVSLVDLSDGQSHILPRAQGFAGEYLLEIRGPESSGFFLNPAVVPVHDPTLVTNNPFDTGWYLKDGCGHLSVEAFWQSSKVIQARYDRFLQLGSKRNNPLELVKSIEALD